MIDDDPLTWNFLVYGPSGSGKTRLGVTAPDPLVLLGEAQGAVIIRKTAHELGKPVPPTVLIQSHDELAHAIKVLRSSKTPVIDLIKAHAPRDEHERRIAAAPYDRPMTVVVDSLTEFTKLVDDDLFASVTKHHGVVKLTKEGLPERSMNYARVLKDRCDKLFRALRDLPYHVLMLALQDDFEVGEGEQRTRVVQPMLVSRRLGEYAASVTNAVGLMEVSTKKQKGADEATQEHRVRFYAPSFVRTKILRPLADFEEPDVNAWVEKLSGAPCAKDENNEEDLSNG